MTRQGQEEKPTQETLGEVSGAQKAEERETNPLARTTPRKQKEPKEG